jgi:hypothetical protein
MCEMPTVYGLDTPKARKTHKCLECGGIIAIGERYFKHHGIWAGSAETFKVCAECEALRKEIDASVTEAEERTPFGGLFEIVFQSEVLSFMERYAETRASRKGKPLSDWCLREIEKKRINAPTPASPTPEPIGK